MLTDVNLDQVTYRVEVWRGGDLLARNLFYDKDGELNVEIRPQLDCFEPQPWRCTQYYGEVDGISGGLFARGNSLPVIDGPIFDKGGLYNVKVDIEGATSPKVLVAEPLNFDTFVSVAQEQNFWIQSAQAQEIPVTVKTYYDDVSNFEFNKSSNAITFDMPFDWAPDYVELVQVVHEEIRVPKSFSPYNPESSFRGYVDGIEVDQRVLLIDPYSSETENIVHFLVTGSELQRINQVLGTSHESSKNMNFKLVPEGDVKKNSFDVKFNNGYSAVISWDVQYGAGDDIPFEFTFFDADGNLARDMIYAFGLEDSNGNPFNIVTGDNPEEYIGVKATEGIDTNLIRINSAGMYKIDLVLTGQGFSNWDPFISSSQLFEVGRSGQQTGSSGVIPTPSDVVTIPSWIKNNAEWWSQGQIDDKTFAKGIEYMIKEGIIVVPATSSGMAKDDVTIPDWVRNNAEWWAEGKIDEKAFANGLQFLIKEGIISV